MQITESTVETLKWSTRSAVTSPNMNITHTQRILARAMNGEYGRNDEITKKKSSETLAEK